MSIDNQIDRVANSAYGRPCGDLTTAQRRELVKKLRDQDMHAEADTLWSQVLDDSIRQLGAVNTKAR